MLAFLRYRNGYSALAPEDMPPTGEIDLAKENKRLRKENRLLLEEGEVT